MVYCIPCFAYTFSFVSWSTAKDDRMFTNINFDFILSSLKQNTSISLRFVCQNIVNSSFLHWYMSELIIKEAQSSGKLGGQLENDNVIF